MSNQPTFTVGERLNELPEKLPDHPLLASFPVWASDSRELQTLMGDLRETGQIYPILIDRLGRVVDGRNRRNACRQMGRPVECTVVDDETAAQKIVSALVHRRHMTQSAIGYVIYPVLEPAHKAYFERRLNNLQKGAGSPKTHGAVSGSSTSYARLEDFAAAHGLSEDTVTRAARVHAAFRKCPEYRERWEKQIIDGEISLEGVIQAIAGKESTEGKTKRDQGVVALCARDFVALGKRFESRWEVTPPAERAEVIAAARAAAATIPVDVAKAIYDGALQATANKAMEGVNVR